MKKVLYILGKLNDQDVDWLMANGQRNRMKAGTALIREGQPVEALFLILEGKAAVTLAAVGNKEIAHLGVGEVAGELSFLDSSPPTATVTMVEDGMVFSVSHKKLAAKLALEDGFAARFYRALGTFLALRLRSTIQHLGYGSAKQDAQEKDEDELDIELLDELSLAGARFEWMLKRLRGQ